MEHPPKLSVVIASIVGAPFIDDCLESVTNQKNAPSYEVIVVDCNGEETRRRIGEKFPGVRLIPQETRKTVPDLRRIGAEHAKGEIIAILEEHCLASEDWMATILRAHEAGSHAAVGGSVVDCDYKRLRDWVTYFCEYNAYMPPVPLGTVSDLPGNNIAFKQGVLKKHLANLDHGYWEAFLYSKLRSENATLFSDPKIVVYHRGPFDYLYYLRQRYLFSRAYAGTQRDVMPKSRRIIYFLASPLLPALLLARIGKRVFQKKCRPGKFLLCLPLLIPVSFVYILGEVIGYLRGPGDSLLKVE
jgi:glycosyltransferase involved in cell wall biosynthesis